MINNLKIIETGNKYGNMNSSANFYPMKCNAKDRDAIFLKHRLMCGRDYGFDGHKMYMALQLDKKGTFFEITKDYVDAYPNGWSDIKEDILIVRSDNPGVAIGHPVADCPVVIVEDRNIGATAIGHCSAELVDIKMPIMVVDALRKKCNSKNQDMFVYISACAGPSWNYNNYPNWAKNDSVWEDSIIEENGIFRIDIRKAILKQMRETNITNIKVSPYDTITDSNFYSNNAASKKGLNQKEKNGRNFAGAFYKHR